MLIVKKLEDLAEALKTKQPIILELPTPSPEETKALMEQLYKILSDTDAVVQLAPAQDSPLVAASNFLADIRLPQKLDLPAKADTRGHLKKAFPRDLPPNIASRIRKLGNFTPPGKPRRHK